MWVYTIAMQCFRWRYDAATTGHHVGGQATSSWEEPGKNRLKTLCDISTKISVFFLLLEKPYVIVIHIQSALGEPLDPPERTISISGEGEVYLSLQEQ